MSVLNNGTSIESSIQSMIDSQSFCVVSTLRHNQPFQHMIAHACLPDLRSIYFANDSSNALAINIAQQASVNVMWDNRTGDVEDEVLTAYITASGFASRLNEVKSRMAKSLLLERNPNLAESFEKPLTKIYCIQIHTYHYHRSEKDAAFFYPNKPTIA
ncbi:MAG: hypothetical protein KAG18_07760 [Sinobacterium sp.]|nr:hypothetical protein [Sinobacterium sp.]